jgi:hypothetical protein
LTSTASKIPTDANGEFTATMNGTSYSSSFVDTGSTYYYFTESQFPEPTCAALSGFFCPSSTVTESSVFSATSGSSSATYTASISVANAVTVLDNSSNYAISDVAAENTFSTITGLDFGMPFFYSRNVFIFNQTSTGSGGYVAFSSNT